MSTRENLKRRPVFWTVGGLSDWDVWNQDFDVAKSARIRLDLMC